MKDKNLQIFWDPKKNLLVHKATLLFDLTKGNLKLYWEFGIIWLHLFTPQKNPIVTLSQ